MIADDCRACGACCFSDSASYVEVSRRDALRLAERPELVFRVGDRRYLRMARGRCAALVRGPAGWSCGIYAERPSECRALLRGSPACLEERREKLQRARRALLDGP